MRRLAPLACLCALALLGPASPAQGAFDLSEFDMTFTGPEGQTVSQAGSHPTQMNVSLRFFPNEGGEPFETVKDILVRLMPGFVGNPTVVPLCETADFLTPTQLITPEDGKPNISSCPNATALGVISANLRPSKESTEEGVLHGAVYNLEPPPGVAAKFGFWLGGVPVTVEAGIEEAPPNRLIAGPTNISQALEVVASELELWGTPADDAHDPLRGSCLNPLKGTSLGNCPASLSEVPFLTLPRACEGPLETFYRIDSWQKPGVWVEGSTTTHDAVGNPLGMTGCGKLDFAPEVGVLPTTTSAESASGLDISIDVADEGLLNPEGRAEADIAATELRLPAGMTVNPSAAEGLGVCTMAQFDAASLTVKGCPDAAKLGKLEVDTPILENHTLKGSFYLAQQDDPATTQPEAENPFDSLLAAYLMIRDAELGAFFKLPVEIETDEASGQIVTRVDDMPPYPIERVRVSLRSGPRAPLITPPACGPYTTAISLEPSSGAEPLKAVSNFQITSGPGGGPCPPGGIPPFDPSFRAGSTYGAASLYSPFTMRLTRSDGDQNLTRFGASLPPGLVPKLAGVAKCPDGAIAAARTKTGQQELAAPSCPANSLIGHVLGGAGVGSALTYVPGSLYLAGPYNGSQISVVAIVPAVAGPFDVGTVVTRVAIDLNPFSYRGEINSAASDPIPHILEGVPLKLRDLRVAVDRPSFLTNPTSCATFATEAQIFGSFADPFNAADDQSVARQAPYKAESCTSLAFKPKLSLTLKGGTKRAQHPSLRSTVTYPYPSGPGYANIGKAVVTLPPSEFIDNAHINNPCTRVQFNANACPPGSVLGTATASSPLLDEPLNGTVYFRSNGGERPLPDVVIDLRGIVRIVLVGAVDTATPKTNPRIRTTFRLLPDAPVKSFSLKLFGGKRGLLVNNRNLCAHKLRAEVKLTGQNGRAYDTKPVVGTSCKGQGKSKGQRR